METSYGSESTNTGRLEATTANKETEASKLIVIMRRRASSVRKTSSTVWREGYLGARVRRAFVQPVVVT